MIAVLEEQWYQKVEGCTNEEVIAHVYRNFSKLAQQEARQRGAQDADSVQKTRKEHKECNSSDVICPRPLAPCNGRIATAKRTNVAGALKPLVKSVLKKLPKETRLVRSAMVF